ncbi:MAG: hypothetical protein GXP09_12880 [Gammaproteobacteria bacterium]|nr:hypothetical protein [Gammaproteobacteria bacterium]
MVLIVGFAVTSTAQARPPKPGPHFAWVPKHHSNGVLIHGFWRHTGKPTGNRRWVSGHYNHNGVWVVGRWKTVGAAPRHGAVWVPGHRNRRGHWVPGRWK